MTATSPIPAEPPPAAQPIDACPLCGEATSAPVLPEVAGIGVVRCTRCGLVHTTAIYPAQFLSESYYGGRAATTDPRRADRPGVARKRRAVQLYDRLAGGALGQPRRGARALDIGCDTGLLLDALRELGYRTEGIERSPAGAQAQAAGHQVHALDIEVTDLGLGRYELITLTHVLEHLRDPVRGLVWLRRHLAPGGLGVVEVPNWGDLLRPLWGRRFRPLELGDHISFFERTTLAAALTRAGLETLTLWSAPQAGTALAPSLLTALDLGLELRRRLHGDPTQPTGVAGPRFAGAGQTPRWRRIVTPLVVGGLDHLDTWTSPWLERLFGATCPWGANLVALVRAPT